MPNRITGLQSGLDTESLITSMVSRYQQKVDKLTEMQKKHTWKQNVWKEINKQVLSFYNDTLGKMKYTGAYRIKKTFVSNANAASVVTGENAMNGVHKMKITSIASNSYMTGGGITDASGTSFAAKKDTKLSDLGFSGIQNLKIRIGGAPEEEILLEEEDTLEMVASKLRGVKTADGRSVSANFDGNNGRFYIASDKTGASSDFTLSSNNMQFLDSLGISPAKRTKYDAGEDASIILDGVTYTSSQNTFEINDLVITTNEVTSGEITLNTQSDTTGMYNNIKDLFKKYNEVVNKLDQMYAAEDGSKYKMLTEDDKKAMSENEVKEWEDKIKDSMLRRDITLQLTLSELTGIMMQRIKVQTKEGEKELHLSQFGINTMDSRLVKKNEWHAYHIDGDEEEDIVKTNENLLKKMIASDPDATAEFFRNLSINLADGLYKLMGSTDYSSSYTLYEDKLMASQYSSYSSKIYEATKLLNAKQDNYYKKFARMEKAMAQLNSTQNQLAGYFNTK